MDGWPGNKNYEKDLGWVLTKVEVVFLWLIVANSTLGISLDFYRRFAYYDKFLHVVNPILLTFILFLAVSAFNATARLRISALVLGLVVVLPTLGLSAVWEVLEFIIDRMFGNATQRLPTMDPLADTMWDLILSSAGGLAGVCLASLYLQLATQSTRRRLVKLISLLAES